MDDNYVYSTKTASFEYILVKLIEWYSKMEPSDIKLSSLTRLKVLKLLFFVSSIKQKEGDDLLNIFDNFYAMQHGPVESDIYCCMTNKLQYFSFEDRNIKIKKDIDKNSFAILTDEQKKILDTAILTLKGSNNDIILYSASQLVSLSHKWESWKIAISIADILGKGSEKMDIKLIRENEQFFSL